MKITEITIGASRTINLGNYNNMKVQGSCTVTLNDNEATEEHLEEAREMALIEVKKQLNDAYSEIKPKSK